MESTGSPCENKPDNNCRIEGLAFAFVLMLGMLMGHVATRIREDTLFCKKLAESYDRALTDKVPYKDYRQYHYVWVRECFVEVP